MAMNFTGAAGGTAGANKGGARFTSSLSGALERFATAIDDKIVRRTVYAGARLLYDELKLRAPIGPTGTLNRAVYHWHDDKKSTKARQTYAVGVNMGKAPHWHLVEYGHWRVNVTVRGADGKWRATKQRLPAPVWVPAHPYLRPTADRLPQALEAMRVEFAAGLAELARGPSAAATDAAGPAP